MDYRDKYKTHPTYGTMKTMVKAGLSEESNTIKTSFEGITPESSQEKSRAMTLPETRR